MVYIVTLSADEVPSMGVPPLHRIIDPDYGEMVIEDADAVPVAVEKIGEELIELLGEGIGMIISEPRLEGFDVSHSVTLIIARNPRDRQVRCK
jgi:hypothetical protein